MIVSGHAFAFDHVFSDESQQEAVYAAIGAPLVEKALAGFNSTMLAYGQTASGKSHSMTGTDTEPGIIPRAVGELFKRMAAARASSPALQIEVHCSMLEIYNETCVDLLAARDACAAAPKGGLE
eukprot:4354924-Prymnesium_polylepis.1